MICSAMTEVDEEESRRGRGPGRSEHSCTHDEGRRVALTSHQRQEGKSMSSTISKQLSHAECLPKVIEERLFSISRDLARLIWSVHD